MTPDIPRLERYRPPEAGAFWFGRVALDKQTNVCKPDQRVPYGGSPKISEGTSTTVTGGFRTADTDDVGSASETDKDAATLLDERCFEGYRELRDTRNLGPAATGRAVWHARKLLALSGKHFGELKGQDYIHYLCGIPSVEMRRKAQVELDSIITDFVLDPYFGFDEVVRQIHGALPPPVITTKTRIRHRFDVSHVALPWPTDDEVVVLDTTLESLVDECVNYGGKGAMTWSRERGLLAFLDIAAPRREDACQALERDLRGSADHPEFGPLGQIGLTGKSHDGSVRPYSFVPVRPEDEEELERFLWYLRHVRPELLSTVLEPVGYGSALNRYDDWARFGPDIPLIPSAKEGGDKRDKVVAYGMRPAALSNRFRTIRLAALERDPVAARRWRDPNMGIHSFRRRRGIRVYGWSGGDLTKSQLALRHKFLSTTALYLLGLHADIGHEILRQAVWAA